MAKIVTFGEIMMRLAPEGYLRFLQADNFNATYGGGEANVAVSLANYGHDVKFVSKLPNNAIGQAAINSLRRYGVDTSFVTRGGDRTGIYFLEKGASQRASKVIYDRANSAFSTASPDDFDWDKIFDGVRWFHFTGITPALSPEMAEICEIACQKAKEHRVIISCDLNYRKTLWTPEEANEVMSRLCVYVDICIANEEDAKDVFGIIPEGVDVESGLINPKAYESVAKQLAERFKFSKTAITLRTSHSASDNDWAAMTYDSGKFYFSKTYPVHIVDRVGGGDSFATGVIHSVLGGSAPQVTAEFSAAASCLKHSIEGDVNLVSVDEVKTLMKGNGSGRVQR